MVKLYLETYAQQISQLWLKTFKQNSVEEKKINKNEK